MNKLFYLLLLLPSYLSAQVSKDYAVLLSATWSESPANITLHWPADPNATSYSVFKKSIDEVSWGGSIAELPGDAISYSDDDVILDSAYEYKLLRESTTGIEAEGYILSAIKLHLPDYRGKCLLIVDTTISAGMENELFRLMKDISGDGWSIERIDVDRNGSPIELRNLIISKYEADNSIAAIMLFGHVPVLYSGDLYPDGHPDHEGAWPADAIYGDMMSAYTDEFTDVTVASRPENWNVPGDGKYDQSILQSKLKLEVGRVDLSNLPSFTNTEEQLLKNYLDQDHAFRNGFVIAERRALIDDNFGAFGGEAFASSGWRNFSPMFGSDEIYEVDYLSSLHDSTYLWSYGCGGGWYQGASGVGSTTDLAADTTKSIFTLLFGSYFGDWDVMDNFLRAPLANGYTLTNAWAGRPHWHFHPMVLGETIGYCARLTQNNQSAYISNIFPKYVHIALMGDPTLRMHTIQPVSFVDLVKPVDGISGVGVDFDNSPDPDVIGYYIYRSDEEFGIYIRLTPDMITDNYWVDEDPMIGENWYMVKAVKLEETPSGSYYNLSTGIIAMCDVVASIDDEEQLNNFTISPNPSTDAIQITFSNEPDTQIISIVDVEGKLIRTLYCNGLQIQIDISDLAAGIYFVKCGGLSKKIFVI